MDMAGLPFRIGKLTPSDFPARSATFFDYITSDLFRDDLDAMRGIAVWGDPAIRGDLLSIACKSFALSGISTHYVTLHQLVGILTAEETERRKPLARCEHLFVDWFEQDFRGEMPYTARERIIVQEFLLGRVKAERWNHYAINKDWPNLTWWSADFIAQMQQHVRSVNV